MGDWDSSACCAPDVMLFGRSFWARRLGARLPELNPALLSDRGLLDRVHLALEPGKLGGGLLVAAHKERRRPEDDDRCRSGHRILRGLAILRARHFRRVG